jgi:hypothetical protein
LLNTRPNALTEGGVDPWTIAVGRGEAVTVGGIPVDALVVAGAGSEMVLVVEVLHAAVMVVEKVLVVEVLHAAVMVVEKVLVVEALHAAVMVAEGVVQVRPVTAVA